MDKEAFLISQMHSELIGDDGAVVGDTVYSADAFCEGTHYRREWMTPYQIGRKAMLVNLSDVVAMNADARYALVMLSIPREMSEAEIAELSRGLEERVYIQTRNGISQWRRLTRSTVTVSTASRS